MSGLTLSGLCVYPLKSARGCDLTTAEVRMRGLRGDRRWQLVDAGGRFVSQRSHPRLARLTARLEGEVLRLGADGCGEIRVPPPDPAGPRTPVEIWQDTVDALSAGAEPDAWLSRFLGEPVGLVFMDAAARRPARLAPEVAVSFADGYPYLLACESSLADLNARIVASGGEAVGMDRFRPNLVVRGGDAFDEDRWRRLRIGAVTFEVVKPCARCVVTTTDQATGERGHEPLRTLAAYRRRGEGVDFGLNLVARGEGVLRLGDAVAILA